MIDRPVIGAVFGNQILALQTTHCGLNLAHTHCIYAHAIGQRLATVFAIKAVLAVRQIVQNQAIQRFQRLLTN